jgi:hypothetical protein
MCSPKTLMCTFPEERCIQNCTDPGPVRPWSGPAHPDPATAPEGHTPSGARVPLATAGRGSPHAKRRQRPLATAGRGLLAAAVETSWRAEAQQGRRGRQRSPEIIQPRRYKKDAQLRLKLIGLGEPLDDTAAMPQQLCQGPFKKSGAAF